jgi:enoyl-[acyl-carrier protein] reductase II
VRLIKNKFYQDIDKLESEGASQEQILTLLGKGRAKKGMFEGDLDEGELEIGQVSGLINEIKPAADVIKDIIEEFNFAQREIGNIKLSV